MGRSTNGGRHSKRRRGDWWRWRERRRLSRRARELEAGLTDRRRRAEERIKHAEADALRRLKESDADYAEKLGDLRQRTGEVAEGVASRMLKVEGDDQIPMD